MMNRLTAALVGIGLVGCTSQVPLDNSKCPCPASLGYVCCNTGSATSCIRPTMGETCNPGPVADAGPQVVDASPQVVDASPQVVDATVLSPVVSIAIGRAHACALREDFTVNCMGDNSKGQSAPPPGQYSGLIAGGDVTCGYKIDKSDITKNGSPVCWGDNTYGQTSAPDGVLALGLGLRHACGADANGNIICWGDNSLGQTTVPSGTLNYLTVGHNHNCAIRPENNDAGVPAGTIVCWGDNSLGQTAAPRIALAPYPFMIAAGDHTCAMDNGYSVWCWGDKSGGQSTPPIGSFDTFAIGPGHGCGLIHGADHITCWGDEWGGALPAPPSGSFGWVWAGDYLTCVGAYSGSPTPPICWGTSYQPWH